jgi:uncharacterized Zn finger protein
MAPRRTFGRTWWGGAWVDALEQRARLDANRLPRGRTYARQDRVGTLTISPGFVEAPVQGSRPQPYVVTVRVRAFGVAEWDRVLDAIAARAAHAAALLDGELPAAVLADAQEAGIDLLPGPGEVQPRCSCPDWAEPCKHAAAVCYLVADVLDADPFELLHLRGRTRAEVLEAVRSRRRGLRDTTQYGTVAPSSGPAGDGPVTARAAFERPQPDAAVLWGLGPPPPPAHPGHPAPLAGEPPARSGVHAADVGALAADAATRAWAMLRGEGDGGLALSEEADIARRAASLSGVALSLLAARTGHRAPHLARAGAAWRAGGEEAWFVTCVSWSPVRDPALAPLIHDGRRALAAVPGLTGPVRTQGNKVQRGDRQLRLAPSGRWYAFARVGNAWTKVAGPDEDPAALLADR